MNNITGPSKPNFIAGLKLKVFSPSEIAKICKTNVGEVKKMLKQTKEILRSFDLSIARNKIDVVGEGEDILKLYKKWREKNKN